MDGGPYASLIRSWVTVFPSWEAYNAEAEEHLRFDPGTTPLTKAPHRYDNRGCGVVNDLTDVSAAPDPLQIVFLPAEADPSERPEHGDESQPCGIVACGPNWEPPILVISGTNLREAKSVYRYAPRSLTAALHDVRAHR